MRTIFACIAFAIAVLTGASPALAQAGLQKNKLSADPPVLRVSPGYDYMAGDPNGLSVEVKHGEGMWLVYYHGKPGNYVGDPNGAPTGKREIIVETSTSPTFANILGTTVMTPNAKGHIKVMTGENPLKLNGAPGRTMTYYVRVRSNLGYSNPVTVTVTRSTPFAK